MVTKGVNIPEEEEVSNKIIFKNNFIMSNIVLKNIML